MIIKVVFEINETELSQSQFATYKAGQIIGKQGLEKEYESILHGKEGSRFVEVDARGRIVREQGAQEKRPEQAKSLQTNIDLDLQRFVAAIFADSLIGGVVALEPRTGGVLALYSGPSWDPNKFIGGVSSARILRSFGSTKYRIPFAPPPAASSQSPLGL